MKEPKRRLKRVFIDLEYKSANDLERSLERLKNDILSGIEKQTIVNKYKVGEMECSHKQWYVLSIHPYQEFIDEEKTIFVIKSAL
jgi:hypothetical protein